MEFSFIDVISIFEFGVIDLTDNTGLLQIAAGATESAEIVPIKQPKKALKAL